MSKKRMLIVTSVILSVVTISLGIVKLYQTYALSNYIGTETDTGIDVYINDDSYVSIPANGSSNVYYILTNTNPGTVKYGVAYQTTSGVTVKVYDTSEDPATGTIEENDKKYIKLHLENKNSTNKTIELSTVLGYENGGDLVVPSGVTLVTDTYTPPTLAKDVIINLYTKASKTTVTNNDITYNTAPSVSLMNDRLGGTTTSLDGGNIRYYGANPNNYIYFNCSDYSNQSSSTCETWRIIGVFNGKLKIIRNNSIGNLAWDQDKNDSTSMTTYDNNWSTATLQKLLNGSYYNGNGTVKYYSYSNGSDTQTLNMNNIGLKNDATRNIIFEATWNLGGVDTDTGRELYANQMYEYERGTTVSTGNPTTSTGKVGLMYISDYGYAVDLGKCIQAVIEYDNSSCKSNNWLIINDDAQWTLLHNSEDSENAWYVDSAGDISFYSTNFGYIVRPVLYLDSDVAMGTGDGTSTNPYQLSV